MVAVSAVARKVRQMTRTDSAARPPLGWSCWWDISDQEIPAKDLETLVNGTFGPEYMPREPRKKKALRLALEAAEREGLIVQIPTNNESEIAYGLGATKTDSKRIDFSMRKENVVILNTRDNSIEFRMDHKNDEIRKAFEKYLEVYTHDVVRHILTAYMYGVGAVTLRKHGGHYFIPHKDSVLRIREFFKGIEGTFYALPVYDDQKEEKELPTAVAQVAEIAKADILQDLELAAADVEHFTGKGDTRDSTLSTRLEKFRVMLGRAEMFRDKLKLDVKDVVAKLGDLETTVMGALRGSVKKAPKHAEQYPYKCRVCYVDDRAPDDWNGSTGVVVGWGFERKNPVCKVLFDGGKGLFPVCIDFLERK